MKVKIKTAFGMRSRECLWRRRGLAVTVSRGLLSITHLRSGYAVPPFNAIAMKALPRVIRAAWLLTDTLDWRHVTVEDCSRQPTKGALTDLLSATYGMMEAS